MSLEDLDLRGRRAMVTGASSGIGAAVASRLHAAGAAVAGIARRSDLVPHGVVAIQADLADEDQLDSVVDAAVEALGGLDIVVNCAGRADWTPIGSLQRAEFEEMVALNLWAPLRICQLAHPHLAAGDGSAVVMIGSVDAARPSANAIAYGATKAALHSTVVSLAKSWAGDGIRVTQVDPGLIDTPMATEAVAALADSAAINLAGRPGTVEEVAALVHYLVSPLGGFANATSFRIDGGALALGPFDTLR